MNAWSRLLWLGLRSSAESRQVRRSVPRCKPPLLATIVIALAVGVAGCFDRATPGSAAPYGGVQDYLSYANSDNLGPFPYYSPADWLWYPEPFGYYQNYGWYPYFRDGGDHDCDDGFCAGRRRPSPFGHPPPAPTASARFALAQHSGAALGAAHGPLGGLHSGFGMHSLGGFHGGGHR